MALIYTTSDGDTVDYIAWRQYGRQTGRVVEKLLEANPGLADYGPVLPAGVIVRLPVIAAEPQARGVYLWD